MELSEEEMDRFNSLTRLQNEHLCWVGPMGSRRGHSYPSWKIRRNGKQITLSPRLIYWGTLYDKKPGALINTCGDPTCLTHLSESKKRKVNSRKEKYPKLGKILFEVFKGPVLCGYTDWDHASWESRDLFIEAAKSCINGEPHNLPNLTVNQTQVLDNIVDAYLEEE